MDFIESEEQQLLRQSVAKLAAGFGHEYYLEKSRSGAKASELWQAVGGHGFLGVNLPEAYGGGGQGITELAIVAEELSAAGCPLLLMVVSPAIAGTVISRFGTDEQKTRWLPGLASGDSIFAFAITEPDAGSNSHKIAVTAERDGDEYRLNGIEVLHLRRRRGRCHPRRHPHGRRRAERPREALPLRRAHRLRPASAPISYPSRSSRRRSSSRCSSTMSGCPPPT